MPDASDIARGLSASEHIALGWFAEGGLLTHLDPPDGATLADRDRLIDLGLVAAPEPGQWTEITSLGLAVFAIRVIMQAEAPHEARGG